MADDDHTCPGLVQACEALSKALTEQDRLRSALATAMRERDNFRVAWAGAEAALAAVTAERDALRDAIEPLLKAPVVQDEADGNVACLACNGWWFSGHPPRHLAGCSVLAAIAARAGKP